MQLAAALFSIQPLLDSVLAQNASIAGPLLPLAFPHFIPLCSISIPPRRTRGIFWSCARVSQSSVPSACTCNPLPPPPPSHFKHEFCGQGKVCMADGSADLQQEARLSFTISKREGCVYPALRSSPCAPCVMDASLPVVGTSTRRKGGSAPS